MARYSIPVVLFLGSQPIRSGMTVNACTYFTGSGTFTWYIAVGFVDAGPTNKLNSPLVLQDWFIYSAGWIFHHLTTKGNLAYYYWIIFTSFNIDIHSIPFQYVTSLNVHVYSAINMVPTCTWWNIDYAKVLGWIPRT